jgi:hypothetical protein
MNELCADNLPSSFCHSRMQSYFALRHSPAPSRWNALLVCHFPFAGLSSGVHHAKSSKRTGLEPATNMPYTVTRHAPLRLPETNTQTPLLRRRGGPSFFCCPVRHCSIHSFLPCPATPVVNSLRLAPGLPPCFAHLPQPSAFTID